MARSEMNQDDLEKLRLLAHKLRCLGHFVETQDTNHVLPTDFDNVQYGFSMLINEIAEQIIDIAKIESQ